MRVAGVSEAVNVTSCFDQSYIEQLIRDRSTGLTFAWVTMMDKPVFEDNIPIPLSSSLVKYGWILEMRSGSRLLATETTRMR